jgi:carboxymethylenebutenolidase
MGKHFTLTAADQHQLGAYRADPAGAAKGAMVVIQEIFGVNHHIRGVCDRLAGEGYVAVAPALFDRSEKGFECGYSEADMQKAFTFIANPDFGAYLRDTQAAINALQSAGPVGIMGFCLGGTVSFAAAADCSGLKAAVCYYGGFIAKMADKKPKVPVQMHFGAKDPYIPMSDVDMIRQKQPQAEIHVYPDADHGFHCDERGSYHEPSARLAWQRSMEFLSKHLK